MAKTEENLSGSGSLEDSRIIYVNGEFDEEMVKSIFEKIISLELKDPTKDILMIIDSYGGYCHSFFAIHDAIKICRCDIATLCIGKAMSCGQLLLMSGTKGKRFASKNSRIMVHEVSSGSWGKLTDMEISMRETKKIQKVIENLIVDYTGIKKSKIKKLMQRDFYMSAEEAKKLGLIDHVVETNKDLYKRINI